MSSTPDERLKAARKHQLLYAMQLVSLAAPVIKTADASDEQKTTAARQMAWAFRLADFHDFDADLSDFARTQGLELR